MFPWPGFLGMFGGKWKLGRAGGRWINGGKRIGLLSDRSPALLPVTPEQNQNYMKVMKLLNYIVLNSIINLDLW